MANNNIHGHNVSYNGEQVQYLLDKTAEAQPLTNLEIEALLRDS